MTKRQSKIRSWVFRSCFWEGKSRAKYDGMKQVLLLNEVIITG